MQSFPIDDVPASARKATTYAAAVLLALAREEQVGRRPRRLLEKGLATWSRFKGWLGPRDLLELLLEDAKVTQPLPFDVERLFGSRRALQALSPVRVGEWLGRLTEVDLETEGTDYIAVQARNLGINSRLARSELYKIKPHHRVLELPGTGGQLAYHMVSSQEEIYLQDVFTVVCDSWPEMALAGIVAVELGLTGEPPVLLDPRLDEVLEHREQFTHVVGLSSDKGGLFEEAMLCERFPHASVQLV